MAARAGTRGDFQGTVLIADDHEVVRVGLVQLLRRCLRAKKIVQAQRFEEVVAHFEASEVALAIVDLGMPGLTGGKDLARLRALRPHSRVVVLSGSEAHKDIIEALSAGVHGYIVKNQPTAELVGKLRYILSGEIYVPPSLAEQLPGPNGRARPKQAMHGDVPLLSVRQRQVLRCLAEGKANKEIADQLQISAGTVKMHVAALFRVLGATNRAHAAALGKQLLD